MTGDDSGPQDVANNRVQPKEVEDLAYSAANGSYTELCRAVNAVPIEELEALADAWEDCPGAHPTQGAGMAKAKEQCAQELREVIKQYELPLLREP